MNPKDVRWYIYCDYCDAYTEQEMLAELDKEVPVPAYKPVFKTLPPINSPRNFSPQTAQDVRPVCECGAAKCKTTHAHWCPVKS